MENPCSSVRDNRMGQNESWLVGHEKKHIYWGSNNLCSWLTKCRQPGWGQSRQFKTCQLEAWQVSMVQDKSWLVRTSHDGAGQRMEGHDRTGQVMPDQDKSGQFKTVKYIWQPASKTRNIFTWYGWAIFCLKVLQLPKAGSGRKGHAELCQAQFNLDKLWLSQL